MCYLTKHTLILCMSAYSYVGRIKLGETPLILPTAKFSSTPMLPAMQYQQFHEIYPSNLIAMIKLL